MQKIKILQFPVAASKGGVTQYVLNLWRHINHEKFQFDFVTFSNSLDFENELIKEGCNVFHFKHYPEEDEEGFKENFGKILAKGYDVIEIHTSYWKNNIVEKLAYQYGIKKIIIHSHTTWISDTLSREQTVKAFERHQMYKQKLYETPATDYWACSDRARDWLFGEFIPREKVKIIKNTIETSAFDYDSTIRKKLRKQFKFGSRYVIGFVGRLEKVKNTEFLFEVFKIIHETHSGVSLMIVGDGSLKDSLKLLAISYGISDDIVFTGRVDNVNEYLQAMDIFVLPSLFEGFPISVIEADCAGLKCLCSDNITSEIQINDRVSRISLNEKAMWVYEIEKEMNIKCERHGYKEDLVRKGFDTSTQIIMIENLYMANNNEYASLEVEAHE